MELKTCVYFHGHDSGLSTQVTMLVESSSKMSCAEVNSVLDAEMDKALCRARISAKLESRIPTEHGIDPSCDQILQFQDPLKLGRNDPIHGPSSIRICKFMCMTLAKEDVMLGVETVVVFSS